MTPNKGLRISQLAMSGGILLLFLSTLFAILRDRPLIQDGSGWAYQILQQQAPNTNSLRYLNRPFEYPAVILARLSGTAEWTALIVKVWESMMTLHPYGWLVICFFILKGAKRLFLFPILLLSFALSTQIATVFTAGPTAEVLSIFWMILALLVCDLRRRRVIFGICFGSFLLCLSHESAVLPFGLLLAISAWEAWRHPAQRRVRVFLCCVFALGAVECIVRAVLGPYESAPWLFAQTLELAGKFSLHWLVVSGLVIFRLMGRWQNRFKGVELKALWGFAALCLGYAAVSPVPSPIEFINARLICVFVALASGLYFWLASAKDFPSKLSFRTSLNFLVAAALIYSVRADLGVTSQWSQGIDNLRLVERVYGKGCHFVPIEDVGRFLQPYGLVPVNLPTLTIVLQKRRQLDHILFTFNIWSQRSPEEVCPLLETKGIMPYFGDRQLFPSQYFTASFPVPK